MTTPSEGVSPYESDVGDLDLDNASDAFLNTFIAADDPSKKKASETDEDKTPATPSKTEDPAGSDESPEPKETEEKEEATEKPTKKYVEDDTETYIKVKVGEEEHEVPVKDLRRLFGQEAALTKRSQAVAEAQRKADQETAKALASLDVMIKRAQERSKPFREMDFLRVAKELGDEELKILRTEAQRAFEEETFLQNELNGFMQEIQKQQMTTRQATARETITTLQDQASPYYIDGWNQQLYDDIRQFAINEGIDANLVNNVIEAPILKMMHMAMQYKKGQSKVVTQKVKNTPTKIVKTSSSPTVNRAVSNDKRKQAENKLARTGKTDDAMEAFLARMTVED